MNNMIWIKAKAQYNRIILKLYQLRVPIYGIRCEDDYVFLKIDRKNYKNIRKNLPIYRFEIDKELGFANLKKLFIKNQYFVVSFIFGLIFLFFLSNIIVDVKVVHSKKDLRVLVLEALKEEGITRLSFKKNYQELSLIKEKIINKYPENIEWLEIEKKGMKYIIRVEERIINNPKRNKDSCHIVATKDGIIKDLIILNGEAIVSRGDYVRKGDIIISGNITFNNEVKETVCANGTAKAEVWYNVKVTLPLYYKTTKKTGKKRYNVILKNQIYTKELFRNRLNNYLKKDYKILGLFNYSIYIERQEEVKVSNLKYDDSRALNEAIKIAISKINIKKDINDQIITQKVLKKEINNSTINLEMFFAVVEDIGTKSEFIKDGEVE